MSKTALTFIAASFVLISVQPVSAQYYQDTHYHQVPHTTTHMDYIPRSTIVMHAAVAIAASTALPPAASMRRPACAASGCEVATTLRAKTGARWVGYGEL